MDTIYQEHLRQKNVFAVWAGDIANEGDLSGYMGTPFERDFGFLLDQEELPLFTRVFTEPRLHAHYNRPFVKVDVQQLIDQFELSAELGQKIVEACRAKGLGQTQTVLIFPNLRYPEHLSKAAHSALSFIGNFQWPEGTDSWIESESKRLQVPPLPLLKRREWDGRLFRWEGVLRLEGWKGFASYKELRDWEPSKGVLPDGDFEFSVDPVDGQIQPTPSQIRAFEQLIAGQQTVLEQILAAIARDYSSWRGENSELMPPLTQPADLKRLIRPTSISIENKEHPGVASIGIGFSCKWDEEHGMGVRYHDGKVKEVGDIW